MLLLNGAQPLHWAIAGAVIALVTLVLLLGFNRRLGVSSGFENICPLVVRAPYFRRADIVGSHAYRLPFLGGLLLGGVVSAVQTGGWTPMWTLGMFDEAIGFGPLGKCVWMFAGGLLIGFGTRLAGGCTSGHGIFGVATLRRSSIGATLAFMTAGIVTTNLVYRVWSAA
jgi:hypothetical protein